MNRPTACEAASLSHKRSFMIHTVAPLLTHCGPSAFPLPAEYGAAEVIVNRVIAHDKRPDDVIKTFFGLPPVLTDVLPEKLATLRISRLAPQPRRVASSA